MLGVVSALWAYVKKERLQDTTDKRLIKTDATLQKVCQWSFRIILIISLLTQFIALQNRQDLFPTISRIYPKVHE